MIRRPRVSKISYLKKLELRVEKTFPIIKQELKNNHYDVDFLIRCQLEDTFKLSDIENDLEKQDKLIAKLQKQNEILEQNNQRSFRKNMEACDFYKKQIEKLKERVSKKAIDGYTKLTKELHIKNLRIISLGNQIGKLKEFFGKSTKGGDSEK